MLFRKRPVVIEAIQFAPVGSSGVDVAQIEEWCGGDIVVDEMGYGLMVQTLEGRMRASPGDWIIQGVKGEFYPCKPDIFDLTYEPANQAVAGAAPAVDNFDGMSHDDLRRLLEFEDRPPFDRREAILKALATKTKTVAALNPGKEPSHE
jgi:hypothetical protein